MNEFKITPIEQNGVRVLTTAQLAEAYGTDPKIISNNFNRNYDRYTEGEHFYRLTGDELKEFKACHQIDDNLKFAPFLILWTKKGSLLHAKSLNTDQAWNAYNYLLEYYFKTKEISNVYDMKIYEKLEALERKIDALNKKIDIPENNSDTKEIVTTTIETAVSETVNVLAPYIQICETHGQTTGKIPCQPRNYQNSKMLNLPQNVRRQIDEMIISGRYSCQKIADFVTANIGISIFYMTVSRYIKKYFK